MKTMQQNWKRSLATFALLAAFNGPDATPAVAQSGKTAAAQVVTRVPKEQSQGAGAAALLSKRRGRAAPAQRQTQPPAQATPQEFPALSPSAKTTYQPARRPRPDEPAYQEQQRDGATHVSGTIQDEVIWTPDKSPYVMDANVCVASEGTLKIEPGVVVKVTRTTEPTPSIDAYVGLKVMGRLIAEGAPEARIRFTPAAANPQPAREWQGIIFDRDCPPGILKWAVVEGAIFGVDADGSALIAHNIFRKCSRGIYLEAKFAGNVLHNISVHNGSGIRVHTTGSEASATENIFYENEEGVAAYVDATPHADYNLYFASNPNAWRWYYSRMEPGPHDVQADPMFVMPEQEDFRLESGSPARRAGYEKANLGLDIENWSPKSARQENARWLADGGRELWMEGLRIEEARSPREAQLSFEAALKKPLEPDLKHKVSCALGRVLTAQGRPQDAEKVLRKVIKESHYPHLRDMARRHLAEALVALNHHDEASAVLDGVEWPQSKVWLDAAKARCNLSDPRRALASLEPIRQKEPYRYLKALSGMVDQALAATRLQTVMALCDGFDAYPDAPNGSQARLKAARALDAQGETLNAAKLLKKMVETDPFGREAPEALLLLARIEGQSGRQPERARQILTRLCTDYYLFDPLVSEAREQIGFEPLSPRNLILLDMSLQESSIYDRDIQGSYNFGQYEVIQILSRRGFKVHTNERGRRLVPDEMQYYGLVVMNGRYGGSAEPPMKPELIEACEAYVNQGGNLLVIASGEHFGSGKTHLFYNPLLERFGLKFREGAGIPWRRNACVVTKHPALQGLDGFTAYGGVTIDPGEGEVLGSYQGQPIIVAMPYGKGRVVAAGLGAGLLGCCMKAEGHRDQQEDIRKNEALLNRLAAYLLASAPSQAPQPMSWAARPLPSTDRRTTAETKTQPAPASQIQGIKPKKE